jgi:2-hydroxy-6-oxonona-2,4-dienedioate hydrolase
MIKEPLTLSKTDPRVIAAREAEKQLFDHYGLQAKDHYILLPEQGIHVRVSEISTGKAAEIGAGKPAETSPGKPIVIVPGNTGDAFPLASLLATFKGRRIIAINRPGGGLSEGMDHNSVDIRQFAVTTLHTVLQAFNLEDVDIVAHSMGAHWSLWLAMDRPDTVRSLTLLGNPGNVLLGRPPLVLRLMSRRPLNKLIFRLLMAGNKDKALQSLKFMGHNEVTLARLPPSLGDCYYYFRHLPHYRISAISLMENTAPTIDEGQLGKVSQPTLFLLGTKDNFASIATGQRIATALPHCSFHPITDAGHLPWLEDPEACGRLIMDFLEK